MLFGFGQMKSEQMPPTGSTTVWPHTSTRRHTNRSGKKEGVLLFGIGYMWLRSELMFFHEFLLALCFAEFGSSSGRYDRQIASVRLCVICIWMKRVYVVSLKHVQSNNVVFCCLSEFLTRLWFRTFDGMEQHKSETRLRGWDCISLLGAIQFADNQMKEFIFVYPPITGVDSLRNLISVIKWR